jgi:hypothetical protein
MKTIVQLNGETAEELPLEEYPDYIKGGKVLFVTWFAYISFAWAVKAVALSLVARVAYVPNPPSRFCELARSLTNRCYLARASHSR